MNYLDKPWLKSYKLGPYALDHSLAGIAPKPVNYYLDEAAARYPTQTAILFKGSSLKYHQLKDRVDRLAGALVKLGLQPGERVCLYLPNCVEYLLMYWAVLKAGGAVVSTSILRKGEGLRYEVGSSGSRILCCQEDRLDLVQSMCDKFDIEHILVTSNEGYNRAEIQKSLPNGTIELRTLLETATPLTKPVDIDPQVDLCELAFTGGATGVPKGVMISHANRYSSIMRLMPWLMKPMLSGISGKSSVLIAIPMFHTYGNFIQITAVCLGLRMILLPDPRDTEAMEAAILEHRPFLIPGVPTQFMRLKDAGLKRINSMLYSGAAPLPQEVAEAIQGKTGMPISEGYGLTETATASHINLSAFGKITGFMARAKPGIGVPTPDTECQLLDPQSGKAVPFGEPGEVVLRGPQVMRGYWPEVGSGLTEDGWLHTGDVGVMDEDGYFQIVDRLKDMVNVSGMKVYTTEVDEVLFKHPAVQIAAAFGVPDKDIPGSERVMVVVQLKPGQQGKVSDDDIRDYCRQHLPPYMVPKYVEFREEMPLTVSEKVFKRILREEAIGKLEKG
ncbi:MAG: AMP-binding protein [Anaerolineales bacterium]|nr:AMP-binding protein [Anaerolineales bacterium]